MPAAAHHNNPRTADVDAPWTSLPQVLPPTDPQGPGAAR
jgi:hypothetical protein